MKLLFDENLSPKLPAMLASEYPGSVHVAQIALRGAEDRKVWEYCRAQGYSIVSKDTDFRDLCFVMGTPPKVIWLDVGNASTAAIANLLRNERDRVQAFVKEEESSFLILSLDLTAI